MRNRLLIVVLALVVIPAIAVGAQRFGRRADRFAGGAQYPQIWRLTTLTMQQRIELRDLAETTLRQMRQEGRGALRERARELRGRLEQIVGAANLEQVRSRPGGPLAPEELLYYPTTSLDGISAETRRKIDAVFEPMLAEAREGQWDRRGRAGSGGGPEGAAAGRGEAGNGAQRQRMRALFEVLEALLTRDELIAVKQFVPGPMRNAALRPQVAMRLTSLTMEQEARMKAVFAAFDDETAADRARQEAIRGELRASEISQSRRRELQSELRQIEERLEARRRKAYEELATVLSPEQMKELQAMNPGPPRPIVFTPQALRSIALTSEQERRLAEAMRAFRRETADERAELETLREQARDGDIQSMENAPLRDELRKNARVLEREREELARLAAATLTPEQLRELVGSAVERRDGSGEGGQEAMKTSRSSAVRSQ